MNSKLEETDGMFQSRVTRFPQRLTVQSRNVKRIISTGNSRQRIKQQYLFRGGRKFHTSELKPRWQKSLLIASVSSGKLRQAQEMDIEQHEEMVIQRLQAVGNEMKKGKGHLLNQIGSFLSGTGFLFSNWEVAIKRDCRAMQNEGEKKPASFSFKLEQIKNI